jgi:integrase
LPARRTYGTGSIIEKNGNYFGKWRVNDRQVMRKIGPVRTPHRPNGITKTQAEARLRDLIQAAQAAAPIEHARTLHIAADAWIAHLEANGTKASSVRAYRAALNTWFLPTLKTRSLDRITSEDVEHAIGRMRKAELSDKTIRNYVGVLRALFNYAADKRRRWACRNPVDDVDLPRAPSYSEIRYLTTDEVWALVDAVRPVPIPGTDGSYEALDRAMYLTAAMTGLRIGELQALDWRSVDFMHARIRVRRTWDRKTKTYTKPSRGAQNGPCRCPTR